MICHWEARGMEISSYVWSSDFGAMESLYIQTQSNLVLVANTILYVCQPLPLSRNTTTMKYLLLVIILFYFLSQSSAKSVPPFTAKNPRATLPEKLIVGYASWGECDPKIVSSAQEGVNVIIWFALNLISSGEEGGLQKAKFVGGPDLNCVADIQKQLDDLGLGEETVHLISVGGWDAPHLNTDYSPSQVYAAFEEYDRMNLFDGVDWDLEGNDDLESESNIFTIECLNLMGDFSTLLHDNGYFVSMAPPVRLRLSLFIYHQTFALPNTKETNPFFFCRYHRKY